MSDQAPPISETFDPVGRSLAAVGFGMFALLAQVPLDEVVSLPGLDALITGQQMAAEAAAAPSALDELAAFDDVALAESVNPAAEQAAHAQGATPGETEPAAGAYPAAALAAPTLAMLNEISYLDG